MAKKEINNDLVKTIKGSLSGTKDIESKGSVFEETLPEGLTPEVVKKVNDHVTDFVAAGYVAFAQHSADVMANNKDINETTGTIGTGALGDITYSFDREKTINPPKGEPFVQKLAGRTNVRFKSGESGPLLKTAREEVRALAEKSL